MRRRWFKRHFGWIADDFRDLLRQLKDRHTWIFIAIAALFSIVVYYSFTLAIRMDFTMRLRNLGEGSCREIENLGTASLVFGTTFLALTIIMVFGEFSRHLDYKRRNAQVQARKAALQSAGWGVFGMTIGVAMVVFLQSQCS